MIQIVLPFNQLFKGLVPRFPEISPVKHASQSKQAWCTLLLEKYSLLVVRLKFNHFLEIEKGIEGLIHISELSDERVEDIRIFSTIGEMLEAKIIHLDSRERKIGLSIKALKKAQEKADMDAFLSQKEEDGIRTEEDWKQELRDLSKTLDLPDADQAEEETSVPAAAKVEDVSIDAGDTEAEPAADDDVPKEEEEIKDQ